MLDCVICLRETQSLTTLTCSHSFCEDCIQCWLAISNKCPLCTQIVSDTATLKHQQEQHEPCVDFSYNLSFVQRKLGMLYKLVNSKLQSSQNIKSNVSKLDAQHYYEQYKEAEELIHVFELLVTENSNNGEVAHLLETINFKLLDLENMLNGRVEKSFGGDKWVVEEDYEEDFPEIEEEHYEKFQMKVSNKGNKAKKQKNVVK